MTNQQINVMISPKNNVGDIFYKDLADKELKDLRYIKIQERKYENF